MFSRTWHIKASIPQNLTDSASDLSDYFDQNLDLESLEDSSDNLEDSSDNLEDSSDNLEDSSDDLEDSSDDLDDLFDDPEDDGLDQRDLKDFFQRLRRQRKHTYIDGTKRYPLYEYDDLSKNHKKNIIRVLTLEPGEYHERLRGHLRIFDVERPPKYQAISYRWSDSTLDCKIEICNSILVTTRSAGIALKRVRHPDKKITVWIDAVCIDQANASERGCQVELIGRVFKQAQKVLVCLDGDSEHAEAAFKLVEDIHELTKSPLYNWRDRADLFLGSELKDRIMGPDSASLAKLFEHEWFSRLWAVPEVSLANSAEILCGPFSVAWGKLSFAECALDLISGVTETSLLASPPVMLAARRSWHNQSIEFYEILKRVRGCHASDPRDRVFALLGHPSASKLSITPDYSKSKYQVFLETTTAILKSTGNLGVLGMVQHECNTAVQDLQESETQLNSKLPTWAPRWDCFLTSCSLNDSPRFSAATEWKSDFFLSSDERLLLVRGICFDSITFHSELLYPREIWPRSRMDMQLPRNYRNPIMDIWEDMQTQVDDPFRQYRNKQEAWRAYCNTLTAENCHWHHGGQVNRWIPQNHSESPLDALPSISTYLQEWKFIPDTVDAGKEPDLEPKTDHERALLFFQRYAKMVCATRMFFITRRGHYGLGPMVMLPGDKVCILFGMSVPVVLRPCGTSWQLVGECYVNGIMHGEVIDKWREAESLSETFRII